MEIKRLVGLWRLMPLSTIF